MATILVPTDFSEAARNASIYASALAKEMNYDILLYHAYSIPIIVSSEMQGTMLVNIGDLEEGINARLKEEIAFLAEQHSVNFKYKTTAGPVVDQIVALELKLQPVLIVMGISTAGPVSEFIFGSTATDVLRKITTPLMIIPEKVTFKKIKKIAFTNDYKIENDIVMNASIKELIKKMSPFVYILNVHSNSHDVVLDENTIEKNENRIEAYFDDIFHIYYQLENEDIVEGINEFIKKNKIDIVTMMPHKHNLFEKLFSEGVTKKLAFHTHIPLLSLPCHFQPKFLYDANHAINSHNS